MLARWHVQVKAAVDKAIEEDAAETKKAEEEAAAMEGALDAEVVGRSPVSRCLKVDCSFKVSLWPTGR